MKTKRLLSLVAMLLCLVVGLSACAMPFNLLAYTFGPYERRTVPFSQMQYARPDVDALVTQLEDAAASVINGASFGDIKTLEAELSYTLADFYTMRNLADLKTYLDTEDGYYEEEYRYLQDYSVTVQNDLNKYYRAIIESPHADAYKEYVGGYAYNNIQRDILLSSDAVESYKQERNQLAIDYQKAYAALTLEVDGQSYSLDDIVQMYYTEGEATYYAMAREYYKQSAELFTGIYSKMIDLDKQTARELGFASAADMYYESYYRDYTPSDALAFCNNIKEILKPLSDSQMNRYYLTEELSLGPIQNRVPKILAQIDPDLQTAWQFMLDYELFDFAARPEKMSGIGFTTYLSSYDAPFVYTYWDGSFHAASTILHEFGHFYDNWYHYDKASNYTLDIAETYSQGLELLAQPYYDEITDYPDEARASQLRSILIDGLLFQAMLEEFQLRAYELGTFDATMLARLYADIQIEYGLETPGMIDEDGCDYSWLRITHAFDYPFYTISYVTSASAAMQMWSVMQDDPDAAVQMYFDLVEAPQDKDFLRLLESVGFSDPMSRQALETIESEMSDYFDQVKDLATVYEDDVTDDDILDDDLPMDDDPLLPAA